MVLKTMSLCSVVGVQADQKNTCGCLNCKYVSDRISGVQTYGSNRRFLPAYHSFRYNDPRFRSVCPLPPPVPRSSSELIEDANMFELVTNNSIDAASGRYGYRLKLFSECYSNGCGLFTCCSSLIVRVVSVPSSTTPPCRGLRRYCAWA